MSFLCQIHKLLNGYSGLPGMYLLYECQFKRTYEQKSYSTSFSSQPLPTAWRGWQALVRRRHPRVRRSRRQLRSRAEIQDT